MKAMAKRKRHNAAEIAAKLGEVEALVADGHTQSEIAKALGVSIMTLHRWRKAGPQVPRSRLAPLPAVASTGSTTSPSEPERQARIGELQVENGRLRKLVTDLLLEKMRLEDEVQRIHGRTAKSA
jgi:putative transposase